MNRRRPAWGLTTALLLAVGGCSDDPAPSEIRFSPGSVTFDALRDTATVVATVIDEDGREMRRREVEWSSGAPGVATVSAQGRVTAVGPGTASILATSGKASGSLSVTVAPAAAVLQAVSPVEQTGVAGDPLPEPIRLQALDRLGNAAPGVELEVRVDAGRGQVSATTLVTDAAGQAEVAWTLGPVAGDLQQLRIRDAQRPIVAVFFLAQTVAGPAAEVAAVDGAGQVGLAGATLPTPIRLQVRDRLGNPRAEEVVTFSVLSGGGSLESDSGVTDSLGIAEARWTLGAEGGEQRLSASVGEVTAEVSATAITEPVALRILAGAFVSGVVGEAVGEPVSVRLEDASGAGVPGVPVRFAIPAGDGAVLGAGGGDPLAEVLLVTDGDGVAAPAAWILGSLSGPQELEASFPGLDPVVFVASAAPGAPAAVTSVAGDFQAGAAQGTLPEEIVVRVDDRFGNAVPGVPVDFQVTGGGGSVTVLRSATDDAGTAAASWTLGPLQGLQVLTAGVVALAPVEIYAAGLPVITGGYHIDVEFLAGLTPDTWAAFQLAAARWRRVILEDIPDVMADVAAGACAAGSPAVQGLVDDVRIFVTVVPIDGAGGTLGAAGPCWIRGTSKLPFLGRIRLDSADLDRMAERGILVDLITHEIGHVLGIGTLWKTLSLVQNPSLVTEGADTYFSGTSAIAAFDAAGGGSYTGAKVPVENEQGGQGTQDVHWRESVMDRELMTGYIDNLANPLSIVTAASLEDMGYVVDIAAADSYSLVPGVVPRLGERVHLENDILWIPLRTAPSLPRR